MNDSIGSFVVPKNPSITGFGQRKLKEKHKKVLEFSLKKSNDRCVTSIVDVCLRLKPQTNNDSTKFDTLSILSNTAVACNNENEREYITEYTFSSVFGPNVNQETFFKTWVYDKILNFLNGNNELLFTCGTTSADKIYTIHGNLNDPGMIPRTLSLVFNIIKNKLISNCKYKPTKIKEAQILDEKFMKYEEDIRNNILDSWSKEKNQGDLKSMTQTDEDQTLNCIDQLTSTNISKIFNSLKDDENLSLNHKNVSYTVWVTYSEIYNECIYDLLIANQKQTPLKLALDQNKNVYIRDLTHIFVQSAEEAYKVMFFGRNNLKNARNNLNKLSCRSHCTFTLKLMQVENIENPIKAVVSSISFCELAGSESLKETIHIGDRITEFKNINNSLFVLNKCFSVMRENQKRGENHLVVPCRESKLTQMFQDALTGHIKIGISMTVSVDMSPFLLEETKQILSRSAIVRSVIKLKTNVPKLRPSSAKWATNNPKKLKQDVKSEHDSSNENIDDSKDQKQSMITIEHFELVLKEEKAKLRKDLLSQFNNILNGNNTFFKNQKEKIIKNKTDIYENKIRRLKACHLEKIRELDEKIANISSKTNDTNNYENNKSKSEIDNYEVHINELNHQIKDLLAELAVLKNVHYLRKEDIDNKTQRIESYRIMLVNANEEYEEIEADLNKMISNIDILLLEIKEKDFEIERLTGLLELKDNIMTEMQTNQEEIIAEAANQQTKKYVDDKLKMIEDLKKTINIQKKKIKNCRVAILKMTKQYHRLKQLIEHESKDDSLTK